MQITGRRTFFMAAFAITIIGVALVWSGTAQALDKCKAKFNTKDGTIVVDAQGVTGTLLWGFSEASETNAFADPACIDASGKAKKCTLGAEGTAERITPPPLCSLYLVDDTENCSAFIKKCTPGLRQGGENVSNGNVEVGLSAPYLHTGGLTGPDAFLRFMGGAIPEAAMDDRCGDIDGCRLTLIREYGTTREVFGPIQFSYDLASKEYWILNPGGSPNGTNGDGVIVYGLLGQQGSENCYLSDWDSVNADLNGDWALVGWNTTGTPLTCTLRIDD